MKIEEIYHFHGLKESTVFKKSIVSDLSLITKILNKYLMYIHIYA
jgi:hypothetical protein